MADALVTTKAAAEPPLSDDELRNVRALLALFPAVDPIAEAARKQAIADAEAAVDARQEKLRADAAGLDPESKEYKALVTVGDAEVSALIAAAKEIA